MIGLMKRIYSFFLAMMACLSMQAQYVVSDKYDLWFEDTDHEVTTRKAEYCTEHYQDLRNGCQVRLSGRTVYIYRNGYSILYGDEINLLYNGYYRVRRGNTWYLADEDGDLVNGIYGKTIYYFPFGYVTFQRSSGYWDIYHCSGRKVECYSNESPFIFWNGCFLIKQGRYWYAVNDDGDKIDGVYGDEVQLLNDGRWKCVRGSYVSYIE
jgi:hypothetical protein